MKIYVIRHGRTEMNKQGVFNGLIDEPLLPEGREQARVAAESLPQGLKHIYSSPLSRTRETAEILNTKLNLPISLHDELEEIDMGSFNGQKFTEERKQKHRSLQYDWRPQGGESFDDVKQRILKFLKKLKTERGDGEALIVTHGGIIRVFTFLEKGECMEDIRNVSFYSFDLDKILANN